MPAPLIVRTNGDIISSDDPNSVKQYIEDGTYRTKTLSLSIQNSGSPIELIDSAGGVKPIKIIAPTVGGINFYASNGTTLIATLDESGNLKIKGGLEQL